MSPLSYVSPESIRENKIVTITTILQLQICTPITTILQLQQIYTMFSSLDNYFLLSPLEMLNQKQSKTVLHVGGYGHNSPQSNNPF